MTHSLLTDAFGHHVWATLRLIDACGALTAEQLHTTVPGTYGSILDTLRHLVGSDRGYLSLFDADLPLIDDEHADLRELRDVMGQNGPAWERVVTRELDAGADLVRHRDDGSDSHAPIGIRLAQVVHHGTDHRSQICTALTSLGIQPPEIDAWDYGTTDGRVFVT